MTDIIVYTKSSCNPCARTKDYLRAHNIPFVERNIETDEGAIEEAVTHGFRSMPIVVTPTEKWAGLNLERLSSLARV